jgi:hypothetical protein
MKIEYDKYEYHSEFILKRKFYGPIDIADITDSWDYLIENNLLNETHKGVINDIRDAELTMNVHNFDKLINYLKKHDIFQRIKLAVVCDTPGKIIFPLLGDSLNPDLKIKPFSTVEAAADWILF